MPFPWNMWPWNRDSDLNVAYWIKQLEEISRQAIEDLTTLEEWKTGLEQGLATWKTGVITAITTWENEFSAAMALWKTETEGDLADWKTDAQNDIDTWESDTLAALNTWKAAFIAEYETLEAQVSAIVSSTVAMVENLAPPFSASTAYAAGDYVIQNGLLYRFTANHPAGAWDGTDASQTTAMEEFISLVREAEYYNVSEITQGLNEALNGVTFVRASMSTVQMYGTAGANRRVLFMNGQKTVRAAADAFLRTLPAGKYQIEVEVSGTAAMGWSTFVLQYSYGPFSQAGTIATKPGVYEIEFTAPVMIGISQSANSNYGTAGAPTTLSITIKRKSAVDSVAREDAGSGLPATGDTTDRTGEINALLAHYKALKLGEGDFYVGNIVLPEGAILKGSGKNTRLIKISSDTTIATVTAASKSTIKDLTIKGTWDSQPTADTPVDQNRIGIAVEGVVEPVTIQNCFITGFTYTGINVKNTGTSCKSVLIDNCEITFCRTGINLQNSEYACVSNTICRDNYIGCNNAGGNNKFACCGFDSNGWGFVVADATNDGHGSCVACSFNHNVDRAISAQGIDYGFIFSGCQIHYGTITINATSKAIFFVGCEIGSTVVLWQQNASYPVFFNSCLFQADIRQVTGYSAANAKYTDSYTFDGTAM